MIGAILTVGLLAAPFAYAETNNVSVGDPYTDTLQLWNEIASALSSLGNDVATLFGHQLSSEPTASAQQGPASLAAAAGSFNNTEPAANTATSSEPISTTTSAPTTVSQNVTSTESRPTLASILSSPTPAFNASSFVTQSELGNLLLTLRNSLAGQFSAGQTAIPPQNVAADGNGAIPYAAENDIGNLSNVTITNANLTAAEIPALNYFPSTSTISITYGGTGISSLPTFGQLLLGNGSGGYNLVSTSSLGIVAGSSNVSTSSQNTWSALQLFAGGASTTQLSVFNNAWFGATATSTFTSAGWLGVGTSSPLAPIQVGNSGVNNSVDSQILVSRNVNNTVSGNGHAFSDLSQVSRSGVIGYNSYDARIDIIGTNNFDHYVAFQAAPTYESSGTINDLYGLYDAPSVNAGTVLNCMGVDVEDNIGSGGAITNNYGIFVDQLSSGASNYAVYTVGNTKSYFGGNVGIGTTSPYSLLSVAGQVVAQNFVATSTTATSTLAGNLIVGTGSENIILDGTTTPFSDPNADVGFLDDWSNGHTAWYWTYKNGLNSVITADNQHPAFYLNNFSSFTGLYLQKAGGGGGDYIEVEDSSGNSKFIVKNTGNVGIGTTSPYSLLSVAGQVVAQNFVATSTTATSTLAGNLIVGTGSENIILDGTTTPFSDPNADVGFLDDFSNGHTAWYWTAGKNGVGSVVTAAGQHPAFYLNNFSGFTGLYLQKAGGGGGDYIEVETSAGTPVFSVKSSGDVGVATLAAGTSNSLCYNTSAISGEDTLSTCSSDQRLKQNITALDGSTTLAQIMELNPVSFNWNPQFASSSPLQFGLIAQQVQQVWPNLVSTTSPTALTPDGTLSLNFNGLFGPIVSAIQAIANVSSTFQQNLIAWLGNAENGIGDLFANNIHAQSELCVGSTCVTPAQFQSMVAAANAPQSSGQGSGTSPSDDLQATDSPPILQINGDNSAIVQVGATYNDLGATITGPQQDLNLGISTFVNGIAVSPVEIDTSEVATDTINYVATDQNGLTSTSTRTVTVESPANDNQATATTTSSTSTPS